MLRVRQWNLDVRECEEPMLRGNEALTGNDAQYREHALIEHIPGAHLLLDHLLAG
jgi:hypothetical protein